MAMNVKPFHEYTFSCFFERISKQIRICRSPAFRPLPSSTEEWCVELTFSKSLEVRLIRLTAQAPHKKYDAKLSIWIGNTYGKKWLAETVYVEDCLRHKTEVFCFCFLVDQSVMPHTVWQHMTLDDDKLHITGDFTFSEYDVPESTCKYQSTLIEDQRQMYRNSTAWDIIFCLHDGVLKAHKCIVMSRSPVFAAMFEHRMLEKITNQVPIKDIDSRVFDYFLLFLYTGEIEDQNFDTVLTLYYVAEKYQVSSLQKACSQILGSKLDENSVCMILVLSDRHGDSELKESAKRFLLNCFNKVSSKSEWLEIVEKSPKLASEVLGFVTKSASC